MTRSFFDEVAPSKKKLLEVLVLVQSALGVRVGFAISRPEIQYDFTP